ncbi:5-formyltetrahydrofolate cyclo-ligase [Amylibacter marinus]|uniref:5-formyltetrahydrofolate cyclo-ligase n=1 Tax=Amylibacter marinus TaxID=1475483 RepID=A0ABQ5VU15_9RHOB|nr:5-formyltetrahydrofolate cyclo-ligase [Amylibacter marinus]GLQ34639.1 5-formyltetrahydrofolate cyclo-ligase [Amylibacter marinus]
MDISSLKQQCRQAAFAARAQAHISGVDAKANAQLISFLKMQDEAAIIAAYLPIRTELSPLNAMSKMVARGRVVCVPVVMGTAMPLEFHQWAPDAEMTKGAFGTSVPKNATVLRPDIVITPLAAFDRGGYRLGYGGGFYDRSFAQLSETKDVQAVGFAYSEQEVMMVPREDTDYALDAIITEKGILTF